MFESDAPLHRLQTIRDGLVAMTCAAAFTIGLGCATATAGPALIGGNRAPHATQNRLPGGFLAEHMGHAAPSPASSGESKLNVGASGRPIRLGGGASPAGSGRGTRPRPVGGVGGTTAACETSRRPQSWQNARLSGLLRPQRSQITPLKGNPQVPVASSAFPGAAEQGLRAFGPRDPGSGPSHPSTCRHRSHVPARGGVSPAHSSDKRGIGNTASWAGRLRRTAEVFGPHFRERPIYRWTEELFPIP